MKTKHSFLAALTTICAMTMTIMLTSCTNDDNPVTEPIEYGKVFSYAFDGNTLYYVIDESSQTAILVAPLYPDYPVDDEDNFIPWQGYEQPKGSVTIPEAVEYGGRRYAVTALEEYAFMDCDEVTAISIPAGVTAIEGWTFWGCTSLETINLPEGLTTIGYASFCYCSNLTDINFPSTLTTIGDYAFLYADRLGPNIIIPEGVTEIGYSAFARCNSIESVTLPSTMQSIGWFALAFNPKLSNVVFPDNLSHLSAALLSDCPLLTVCHLPAQMEYIDNSLFANSGITYLDIPEHVTRIEEAAFESCLSLRELSLPATLTEIADGAFANGTVPEKLTLASEVPPSVKESTFTDYTTAIIVPKGTCDAYRSHDIWGRFANITEQE